MNSSKPDIIKALITAFPHTMPVLTGFSVLGAAYGFLMQTKGYGTGWSVLFSAAAFCGSMQFVAITLLTAVFNPVQAFFLSIMVNARHLFYGISMLDKYKGLGKIKYFLIYTLCDETFSISSGINPPPDVSRKYFFFFVSLLNYLYWISGTFIGSILGNFLIFDIKGLDFVLTALFVVLLAEQFKKAENRRPAIIGTAGTIAGLLIFGPGNVVIPSMFVILAVLAVGRNQICS